MSQNKNNTLESQKTFSSLKRVGTLNEKTNSEEFPGDMIKKVLSKIFMYLHEQNDEIVNFMIMMF